ncbi:ISXO2-like transposase domain protein [Acidithrix ferrooxidans]|uniref:ISXO2-like transposase domain protein n=1 Tax=Acidithrix ferrooxidans TaxID=1280514 RepID=A0A0D8HJR5_9ACTN|nr:ISXO2-like transposase domain protein [Acidithrix ferrooxidans]
MEVIKDTTAKSFKDVFVKRLDSDTKPISDGNPSYGACARELGLPNSVTLSKDEQAHATFKWFNTLIGNCKKFIDGTYHGREERKQLYLEEFVYRFNRRRFGMSLVERLLNTCVFASPHPLLRNGSCLRKFISTYTNTARRDQ